MSHLDQLSQLAVVADRALISIGKATQPYGREFPDDRSPELRAAVAAARKALVAMQDLAATELAEIEHRPDGEG